MKAPLLDTKFVTLVLCFNNGFLIIFDQLVFQTIFCHPKQMSLLQVRYVHSQITNRRPTRILYLLLVVDENRYAYTRNTILVSAERVRPLSSGRVGNSAWAKRIYSSSTLLSYLISNTVHTLV
jgi:hypothetical protein